MAAIADIADIGGISVEHLTFGKLVEVPEGAIARSAESEVTSASTGLEMPARLALSPQFLTGPDPWRPSDLCNASRQRGALLVRPVQLGGRGPFYMAAARVRFRPEAGEGMAGRVTAQSSTRIFGLVDWLRNAPFVVDQLLPALEARPDIARRRATERLSESPLAFRPRPLADTALNAVPSGVWLVIEALAEGRCCHLGRETFESEAAFLQGIARVFDLLDESAVHGLAISWTSGYGRPDPRYTVQYFPDRTFASRRVTIPVLVREAQGRGEHWRRFAARTRDAVRGETAARNPRGADQHFRNLQRGLHVAGGEQARSFIPTRISRIESLLADSGTRQQGEAELAQFVKTFRLLFPSELENLTHLAHVADALKSNVAARVAHFAGFLEASAQVVRLVAATAEDMDTMRCCEAVLEGAIARLAHGDVAPLPIFAAACRYLVLHRRDRALSQTLSALTDLAAAPFGSRDVNSPGLYRLLQIAEAAHADLAAAGRDADEALPLVDASGSNAAAICDAPLLVPSFSARQETVPART